MRRNLGVRNVGVIDLISCWYCLISGMHVDQVLDLQSLPREIFHQSSTIVFGGTSRDTCTCIYVYISRISKPCVG